MGRSKGGEGGDLGDRPIGETSGRHKAKLPPTKPAKTIRIAVYFKCIIDRIFRPLDPNSNGFVWEWASNFSFR